MARTIELVSCYCLVVLHSVRVGYTQASCTQKHVMSSLKDCHEMPIHNLTYFSGHNFMSFCKSIECNIQCYSDAIGDCYTHDQFFKYNPDVFKVTSRAYCSSPNETHQALLNCEWKDPSCLETFKQADKNSTGNYNAGEYKKYKASFCEAIADLMSCVEFEISDACPSRLANIAEDILKASLSYKACGLEEHPYFSTYGEDVTCGACYVHMNIYTFFSGLLCTGMLHIISELFVYMILYYRIS